MLPGNRLSPLATVGLDLSLIHIYRSHILTKKPTKRTRNLRKAAYVASGEAKNMKKLIPYK